MAVKTAYIRPGKAPRSPISINLLTMGELYRVVSPASAEGTVVLAMQDRAAVILHPGPDIPIAIAGTLATNTAWKFLRLEEGEYVQLVQGE
ncbi:hypothetical protein [Pseudomonas phage LKD16]|uniref:Uncharacterized protein n=1 Tax=Pseudomonas phage LKD16 TaxID=386792 RepID=Q0E658_9CAUD|nr:hypothetical protein PPLKD16_gp07 [Pseudomonas phage LKD16]CAK25941.1 hypothetical protein [Pseudomonas phage LKD16]